MNIIEVSTVYSL